MKCAGCCDTDAPLLDVRHVSRSFEVRRGILQRSAGKLRAVDDVSFTVHRGETLGLVGESGCGKSTLARLIMRLLAPDSGDMFFRGDSLLAASSMDTAQRMQMIFQDPFSSLNPRLRIGISVGEPLHAAGIPVEERRSRVAEMLEQVGLAPEHAGRFPHEFSGGQRQRIAIARALVTHPDFVICDEAVSALDASVQAQMLNLLRAMQRCYGFAYLFISHDLSVVGHMSDRVAVMYLGRMVEIAPRDRLFNAAAHPYAQTLLDAAPVRDPGRRVRRELQGEIPGSLHPPSGCAFHPRCSKAVDICRHVRPVLRNIEDGHQVACHMA